MYVRACARMWLCVHVCMKEGERKRGRQREKDEREREREREISGR